MEGVEGVEGVAGEIVATTLTDGIGACKRGHQEDRRVRSEISGLTLHPQSDAQNAARP